MVTVVPAGPAAAEPEAGCTRVLPVRADREEEVCPLANQAAESRKRPVSKMLFMVIGIARV
jgi:hypothetical protein